MNKQNLAKVFFLFIFILANIYFLFIKSELYESKTTLVVRNLSVTNPVDLKIQDAMVIREYILSLDMFQKIDKKFNLTQHYKSNELDPIQRMPASATAEEILAVYQSRCRINYDKTAGLFHIAFAHTDPIVAQHILIFMIANVENTLNDFNKQKETKQLMFAIKEHQKDKENMYSSSKKLAEYQNKDTVEYQALKMQLKFDTEVYRNSLMQLNTIKIAALKETKTLSIISKPNIPDGYTYPNKRKILITLFLIAFMVYGIFVMIQTIIRDHRE